MSGIIHTEPENFPWTGRCVRSANGIHEVVTYKTFEFLLANSSIVEKKLRNAMVTRFEKRSPVILSAAIGTLATEICESLNLMVDQATATAKQQLRTKVTDLSLAAPDGEIINSTPTNQESL